MIDFSVDCIELISFGFNNDFNNANVLDRNYTDGALGQRYGLEPQTSQKNGWFKINDMSVSPAEFQPTKNTYIVFYHLTLMKS